MDELDIKTIQIPDSWPEDAKLIVRLLIRRIRKLEAEIRELRARLDQNSSNSSRPPSQDPPWQRKEGRGRRPGGMKRGGQPGHVGRNRAMVSEDKVTEHHEVRPTACATCGESFGSSAPTASMQRFQQIDLPQIAPIVREIRLVGCRCPRCGDTTLASPPPEFGHRCVGPRLQATMAYLACRMNLSRRKIRELLEVLLGPLGRLSLGCISECEADIAEALATPHGEVLKTLSQAAVANVDETGWRLMNDTAWLWVATTATVTGFRLDPSRGHEAFMRLLQGFDGILVSDRWSAYQKTALATRQLCWAHLKRDFKKLVDRQAGAEQTGAWALREIERIFMLWHAFLDQQISQEDLRRDFNLIKARFARMLQAGMRSQDAKARRFCKRILKAWPALWTFLAHEGRVEPTNNRAERALRPAVIWRKLSFGCQSERGRSFIERMMTTTATLRQQGRQVLDFLVHALTSLRTGSPAPSLLPVPGG